MVTRKKPKLTITVGQDIIDWLEEGVAKRRFGSISHGFELCVSLEMERERLLREPNGQVVHGAQADTSASSSESRSAKRR